MVASTYGERLSAPYYLGPHPRYAENVGSQFHSLRQHTPDDLLSRSV